MQARVRLLLLLLYSPVPTLGNQVPAAISFISNTCCHTKPNYLQQVEGYWLPMTGP